MPGPRHARRDATASRFGRPEGNRGLARRHVADIQRSRMLSAMVQEVAERGAHNVAVAHIVERSGVSRRTFYEIFEDRDDCFLAAFDEAVDRVSAAVVPAYEQQGTWRTKIRAALTALLRSIASDPATGSLLIVESLGAGARARARRRHTIDQIIPILELGRAEAQQNPPPPLTAEGVLGGVLSVLYARLSNHDHRDLVGLTGPLMAMIVLPYLGPAAARKELERPAPKCSARPPASTGDPLRDLEMRLTYRTLRTLLAVAEQPGASNRAVGTHAGIPDQGQVSKLLARLHGLGLIENTTAVPARGEPNAWTLTARGREIHGAIAGQNASA